MGDFENRAALQIRPVKNLPDRMRRWDHRDERGERLYREGMRAIPGTGAHCSHTIALGETQTLPVKKQKHKPKFQ